MPQHWVFDYADHRYFGTARGRFRLPVYTAPYPDGVKVGWSMLPGHQWQFFEHRMSPANDYISVRISEGWVNVWCRYNNAGVASGVVFADIVREPRERTSAPSVVADTTSAGSGSTGADTTGAGSGSTGTSSAAAFTPSGGRKRKRDA